MYRILEKIQELLEESLLLYKNSNRPYNYIPGYIKRRLSDYDVESVLKYYKTANFNECIYRFVNKMKDPQICANKNCVKFTKYYGAGIGYSKYCSKKCRSTCVDLKEMTSSRFKGRESPLKGKTYKEIYGDKIPKCGFKKAELIPITIRY